jgi:excinuclease ABC subunit C
MDFERAASLRDKLHRLEGLREQFIRFRFAVETLSFVYTVPGHDGDDRIYLIRRGRVRGDYAMPRSEHERMRLLEMVESVFGTVERDSTQVPSHEIDELLLLSSWFRRFPAELGRSRAANAFVAEPPALDYDPANDPLFGDEASSAA